MSQKTRMEAWVKRQQARMETRALELQRDRGRSARERMRELATPVRHHNQTAQPLVWSNGGGAWDVVVRTSIDPREFIVYNPRFFVNGGGMITGVGEDYIPPLAPED